MKEMLLEHVYHAPSEKALIEYEVEPNVAFIYCVYTCGKNTDIEDLDGKCLNTSGRKCGKKASRVFLWKQATFPNACTTLTSKNKVQNDLKT
jgi:hypothetical protein